MKDGELLCTPTGKGQSIIDQLWISPELQSIFRTVTLIPEAMVRSCECCCYIHAYYWTAVSIQMENASDFLWPSQWHCNIQVDWQQPSDPMHSHGIKLNLKQANKVLRYTQKHSVLAILLIQFRSFLAIPLAS